MNVQFDRMFIYYKRYFYQFVNLLVPNKENINQLEMLVQNVNHLNQRLYEVKCKLASLLEQ